MYLLGYKLYIGESNESRNHLQIKAQMEVIQKKVQKFQEKGVKASAQEQERFR